MDAHVVRSRAHDPITHRWMDMRASPEFAKYIPASLRDVPRSRIIELAKGDTRPLSEVAEILDLDPYTILTLIHGGYIIEEDGIDGGKLMVDSILYFYPDFMTRYHTSAFTNKEGVRCPIYGFYYKQVWNRAQEEADGTDDDKME